MHRHILSYISLPVDMAELDAQIAANERKISGFNSKVEALVENKVFFVRMMFCYFMPWCVRCMCLGAQACVCVRAQALVRFASNLPDLPADTQADTTSTGSKGSKKGKKKGKKKKSGKVREL